MNCPSTDTAAAEVEIHEKRRETTISRDFPSYSTIRTYVRYNRQLYAY